MKKIAVIGGGAAGVAAAWSLNSTHNITLFEGGDYLGGHAYTHEVDVENTIVSVDMGVEYFHERLSPNLCALLDLLHLESYVAPLSFRAFNPTNPHMLYWSNSMLGGQLNENLNKEMNDFHLDMMAVTQSGSAEMKGMSLNDFLDKEGYSDTFKQQALLPLMTTFSGCKAPSLSYSLTYFALSFNMNLLSFFSPTHWRKLNGGIHRLYQKLESLLSQNIRLRTSVKQVESVGDRVFLRLEDNSIETFDEVIFACQADIALKLIKTPSKPQTACLSKFKHIDVQSTLHRDAEAIHFQSATPEYCQFALTEAPNDSYSGVLTRVNHRLFPYQTINTPLFVSFDNRDLIKPDCILSEKNWRLPMLRPLDMLNKTAVHHIQGEGHLWFCGTDYSLTGHEGALVSGLVIGNRLGAPHAFKDNWLAKTQFDLIKGFMGVYTKKQRVNERLNQGLFAISKRLKLHERMSGQFIKELFF